MSNGDGKIPLLRCLYVLRSVLAVNKRTLRKTIADSLFPLLASPVTFAFGLVLRRKLGIAGMHWLVNFLLRWFLRFVLNVFFRRIVVDGLYNVPHDGPVVFVGIFSSPGVVP